MNVTRLNLLNLKKFLRLLLGLTTGIFTYPVAWLWPHNSRDPIAMAVADMLLIGFFGSTHLSPSAQLLARQTRKGQVNGIFFVSQNIGSLKQVTSLVKLFRQNKLGVLLAIDHEGGIVQRLTPHHGFTILPCAREIAKGNADLEKVRVIYYQAGQEMHRLGFNLNLGPVLDFDDPSNLAIGMFGRSFGIEPSTISAYATAFVEGFTHAGIICALKHFPGHGHSRVDSHDLPADITQGWTAQELEPFANLIASGHAPMIMSGHLSLASIDPSNKPTTLSKAITFGLLREDLGYEGVIVTDDLDMGAVSNRWSRREAFIEAIAAGNDLLMIKNVIPYDPLLPQKAQRWVREAIQNGQLQEKQVLDAAQRIRTLKSNAGISCAS